MSKIVKPHLYFQISGFDGCPFFEGAISTIKTYKKEAGGKVYDIKITIKKITHDKWSNHLEKQSEKSVKKTHQTRSRAHLTSPFIICNSHFIGGYDQLILEMQKSHPFKNCVVSLSSK